jgi:eukaryotic-like serine/threonine-protein kinase
MKIYPPGTLIANRYEVAGRPLLGGMGIVYLCMDRQEDRPVALKTFQPQFLPDRASRDRFLREGTTWVDLGRHPHIVRCYNIDLIDDSREVFLSLELVAQEQDRQDASLRSWLTLGQALPMEQSLLFALQIARGMKHATEQIPGFVHRDLKPENILVGADNISSLGTNRLRITDFGLSNILSEPGASAQAFGELDTSENLSRTQLTHGIVGTPLYMAPEQWQAGKLGAWTDIYALGCILYEMLSGEPAVSGRTLDALQQAHCTGQVRTLLPALPAVVQDLVSDCLRLSPGERYQEWGSLEIAIGDAWEAISAQKLPPAEAPQELDREERVAVGWSYINIGYSYLDIGKADVAQDYFERAKSVGRSEGDRVGEGVALGGQGLAYAHLGDTRRAIGFHEQHFEIAREIGDRQGEGYALGNLGSAYLMDKSNKVRTKCGVAIFP